MDKDKAMLSRPPCPQDWASLSKATEAGIESRERLVWVGAWEPCGVGLRKPGRGQ